MKSLENNQKENFAMKTHKTNGAKSRSALATLIAFALAIVCSALSLTGCPTPDEGGKGGKTVISIAVKPPTKTEYIVGEELDLSGMVVTATYSDGSEQAVTDYTVSGYDKTKVGSQIVTVSFQGKTDSFPVSVRDPSKGTVAAPIALTENIWADGELSASSLEQWFKFTASASPQYIHAAFGTLDSDDGINVQVYDSSGTAVGNEANLFGTSNRYISRSVTTGQEYYIRVRPYDFSSTGTYRIAFSKSSAMSSVTVTLPSSATQLTENTWADGNLTSSSGEQWFKFTATASTQYIHVSFGTLSSALGVYAQVYDSSGAAIGTETNLWSSTKYISRSVTTGQEYYIKVRGYTSATNGTYQIAFNKSSSSPSVTVTIPSGATPLTENIWADGNLTSSIGEQWFKFTATASTQYIHVSFGTLSSALGVYAQVYDSSGAAIGTETNLWSSTKYISRSVTAGQEDYIKVRGYSSVTSGTYQIAFNKSSTVPAVTVTLPSAATQLTLNTWADGELTAANPEQWFKFTASASPQFIHATFGTMTSSSGINAQMYDSNGIAVGDDTNLYSSISFNPQSVTVGQEYYIKVRRYNSANGTYKIAFNTSPVSPSADATQLTLNTWADGELTAANPEQWFKFTASASPYIHATFGTMSSSQGINVQVYNSSGDKVGTEANIYGTGSNSYIARSVTTGQEYYIRVRRYSSANGTYKIAFNTSATKPTP